MTIPYRLRELVNSAQQTEDLVQTAMAWKPASWNRRFDRAPEDLLSVDYQALIADLAPSMDGAQSKRSPRIDRGTVRALCAPDTLRTSGGDIDDTAVVKAFLASMIWGYGLVGYGPYRTERILTRDSTVSDKQAIEQLVEIAGIAQSEGGVAAFDHVAKERRGGTAYLKFLGPAFGTKFLYFLTKASNVPTTPVFDSVVHGWLQEHAPETGSFSLLWWDTSSYKRYVDLLHSWVAELSDLAGRSLDADDLEFLMFSDARGQAPLLAESENVTAESMLDDLGAEADARGGERDRDGVLLVEALREWFARHPQNEE